MKAINKKRKLATKRILSQLSMLSKLGVIVIVYLINFIIIVMILSAQSCYWLAVAKKKKKKEKKSFRELNCVHSALYDKRDLFHKLDLVKVQL